MAYRAEIEIAVKGASQLSSFKGRLDSTALAVNQLNKFLKNFSDNAEGIPRSLSNLNRQLGKAAQSFNDVALGTKEATVAAVDYLTATRNLNAGLRERAQLLAEVTENERKARLASAGIKERTQYPIPIGLGAASTFGTDQSLVGQSSAVGGRVARLSAIQADDIKLQEALLALNRKTAQEKNKQVDAQEALVRGANEVKALAAEARGETISSSIDNRSPARRQKEDRTRRAEDIAREAALKSKANQEEFAALKTYQDELFNIERSFIRKLRNEKIDAVLDAAEIEGKKQDELLQRIKQNNKEGLDDFDKRLKASTDKRKARSQALTLTGQTSPVGGAVGIPGSPAAKQRTARNKKLEGAASNAIIGGAFPLLFGQGIGASVGGAAGGAGGGLLGGQFGFGLSLVGTALGTAFDELVKSAQDTAKALKDPVKNLNELNESFKLFDEKTTQALQTLKELGRAQEALNIIQTRVSETIGSGGRENLTLLASEAETANKRLGELAFQLQAAIAGPIGQFLRLVNTTLGQSGNDFSTEPGRRKFQLRLNVKDSKELEKRKRESVKDIGLFDFAARNAAKEKAFKDFSNQQTFTAERTPQQKVEDNIKKLKDVQKQLSNTSTARSLVESYTKAVQEQQKLQEDYDKQRVDTLRSYEENLGQTREKVEQRILNIRIQGIQKANQIEDQRTANQLSELKAANRAASQQQGEAAVAAGTRPEFAATAQTIDNAFRAIAEAELSAEQQKAKIKRDAAFEVLKLELEAEKFKADIATQVSKLNIDTARKIERINIGIVEKNKQFNKEKFESEKAINIKQLEVIKEENKLIQLKLIIFAADAGYVKLLQNIIDEIDQAITKIQQAQPPAAIKNLAPIGGEDVSTAGVDTAVNNLIERQRQLTAERLKSVDILKATNREAELAKISSIRIADQATLNNLLLQQVDALATQQRIIELQAEGRSEAQAAAIQQVETTFKLIDANLGVAEAKLKTQLTALQAVEEDKKDLEIIESIRKELEKINELRGGLPIKQKEAVENAANLNKELGFTKELATDVGAQLSTGITDAIVGAVQGTQTLGEAFQSLASDILAAVGKALILKAVTEAIGAVGGGGQAGSGLLGLLFKADGGPVSANQPYIVGERGPELFIPGASGSISNNDQFEAARKAMGGSNNSSNDAFADNAEAIGTSTSYTKEKVMERERIASINSNPIDVRAETTVINNIEYVTVEQFSQGMKSTARDAQARVLSDLRNRPATRAQVGIR